MFSFMLNSGKNAAGRMLKALGDATRLQIVILLASGEKCVCEITKGVKLPQNLISHHLKILRQSKLTTDRRDGKWIRYSLNKGNLEKLQKYLGKIISAEEGPSRCQTARD
jgi:ArsR family transcriptional regulator, arsenate/arsenite/antimonite-responsive transcriptional repressor